MSGSGLNFFDLICIWPDPYILDLIAIPIYYLKALLPTSIPNRVLYWLQALASFIWLLILNGRGYLDIFLE